MNRQLAHLASWLGLFKELGGALADVFAEQGLLAQAASNPHQAIRHYEEIPSCYQDHPVATIGLANLLLDIWNQTLSPEPLNADVDLNVSRLSLLSEFSKPKSGTAISTMI